MTVNALPAPGTTPARPVPRSALEHRARVAALRAVMRGRGIAATVLTSPENVYYLTGLDHLGYFAFTVLVVPAAGELTLVTRAMERYTVRALASGCRHVPFGDGENPVGVLTSTLAELVPAGGTIGVEQQSMFFPPLIHHELRAALPGRDWLDVTGQLAAHRAVKSDLEIGYTRRAAAISDTAMRAVLRTARVGVNEREVAAAVHAEMISAGGQPPGFVPLIRPVTLLAREHVTWADRALVPGRALFVELSGCVRRYHAPLSRTFYLPPVPAGAAEAAEAALAGLAAARDALRPGARTGAVYAAWQHAVAASRSGAWPRRHHCGYLVGIGFPPSWVGGGEVLGIRPDGDAEIRPGMVFHLMSWLDRPVGHVVSDTALVTSDGCELLTTVPRELTVLS